MALPSAAPHPVSPPYPAGWPAGALRAVAIGEAGLVLGAGTMLAPMGRDGPGGARELALDPERVLALLSVAAGRPVPVRALEGIASAARHWSCGDAALANLRLVFAGLPRLEEPVALHKLRAADWLLANGLTPRALMRELDLDMSALDAALSCAFGKYSPDQPRVPAGNGIESGRWIGARSDAAVDHGLHPPIRLAANTTTPNGIILNAKAQKDMLKRGMTPKQIDDAVRSGERIDAINKGTGGPATRYLNPDTGVSVVIDNTPNEVLHMGEPGFEYGAEGGDVPGAVMRPPPPPASSTVAPPVEPLIDEAPVVPDIILPP